MKLLKNTRTNTNFNFETINMTSIIDSTTGIHVPTTDTQTLSSHESSTSFIHYYNQDADETMTHIGQPLS